MSFKITLETFKMLNYEVLKTKYFIACTQLNNVTIVEL